MALCLPCFPVSASNIIILEQPSQFYQTIKDEISSCTGRITMAALYLGSDKLEKEMVELLESTMQMKSDLHFRILLDYARGTRGEINSCTLLQKLVDQFPERAQVSLYHTPHLRGMLKSYLPGKLTESIGLNHIKVFVFDDNLLISGANLSQSYFSNRQDRYILIKNCGELADFFHKLIGEIATFSMEVKSGGDILPHEKCPAHPYTGDAHEFLKESRKRILTFLQSYLDKTDLTTMTDNDVEAAMKSCDVARLRQIRNDDVTINDDKILPAENASASNNSTNNERSKSANTLVYPLIQMGPLDIKFDQLTLNAFVESAPQDSAIYLASGYFNLTDDYIQRIMNVSKSNFHILTASPEVNGFYGAKGIVGAVPDVYTHVSKQFYDKLLLNGAGHRIKLYEYFRQKWTFHVKGLWYYPPGSGIPTMTMIGSSNFGYRSVYRDLEAQIAIVTEDEDLGRRLHAERESLYGPSREVSEDTFTQLERRVPLWVRFGTMFLKSFF